LNHRDKYRLILDINTNEKNNFIINDISDFSKFRATAWIGKNPEIERLGN
jgi:hypothetical protein